MKQKKMLDPKILSVNKLQPQLQDNWYSKEGLEILVQKIAIE